jgi:HAD superfamily hydrolase (TIGR01509 family)
LPVFLSESDIKSHGEDLEKWRGLRFKTEYLPLVKPFSAVPELLDRVRRAGLTVAVASSAKTEEVDEYLRIAGISDIVDVVTSADDAERSKPAPDIFASVLEKLHIDGRSAIAIGDSPYDAQAAGKLNIPTIGVLSGGFQESDLRSSGCTAIFQSASALLAEFDRSPFASPHVRAD